ncbi:MAG: hypothetical protein LLG01_08100 [Planctomycetaceae bacterium]|nr:hypothetical protein [Planctomycetaceae bacterium]
MAPTPTPSGGGKKIQIVGIIAIFAALGATIWLVVRRMDSTPAGPDSAVEARPRSGAGGLPINIVGPDLPMVAAQTNLRNIYGQMLSYAHDHRGLFPPKLADLRDLPANILVSVSDREVALVYLPGQQTDSRHDNILVYDPVSISSRYVALTVGGDLIVLPSRQDLDTRLAKQKNAPAQ